MLKSLSIGVQDYTLLMGRIIHVVAEATGTIDVSLRCLVRVRLTCLEERACPVIGMHLLEGLRVPR